MFMSSDDMVNPDNGENGPNRRPALTSQQYAEVETHLTIWGRYIVVFLM